MDEDAFFREGRVLNQNGKFLEVSKVSVDDNIDEVLKKILIDLGDNVAESLLYKLN
jgi:hypothetical protein